MAKKVKPADSAETCCETPCEEKKDSVVINYVNSTVSTKKIDPEALSGILSLFRVKDLRLFAKAIGVQNGRSMDDISANLAFGTSATGGEPVRFNVSVCLHAID